MFLSPYTGPDTPARLAWDNYTLYDSGRFFSFFNTTPTSESARRYGLDIAISDDGVFWDFARRDEIPIAGAHAGYGLLRVGDRTYYYPTCTDETGIHFKIYSSEDNLTWEYLGDAASVYPDTRYYANRWDELCVTRVTEDGNDVYYGYISSEVREDFGGPSVGMLRSRDGVAWEILPPPVIEWGELPAHHTEVNFCEQIDGRFYLSLSGRFYLGSLGYSLYTFVSDSPTGPFVPDLSAFRLTGTSTRDVTWLGHTVHGPDGLLMALWVSSSEYLEIPSRNLCVGPLKRIRCVDGHLRLAYWEQNDLAKGDEGQQPTVEWAHPSPDQRSNLDRFQSTNSGFVLSAGRDAGLCLADRQVGLCIADQPVDTCAGVFLEFDLTVSEPWQTGGTHHPPASGGLFFENGEGRGYAVFLETHGITRAGWLEYANHPIGPTDDRRAAGSWIVNHRLGDLRGTTRFIQEDQVGPFGHAAYAGVRNGRKHHLRSIVGNEFAELYVDDWYVQTYELPNGFTGRIGFLCVSGTTVVEHLRHWPMRTSRVKE